MAKIGPGYATPLEAMKGPKEKLMYVVCVQPNPAAGKHDLLATIDVDPNSPTYCKIIHRLHTLHQEDELHHSGWNSCSSCHKVDSHCCKIPVRDKLVLPSLISDRIYIADVATNPRAPSFVQVIEPSEMHAFDCANPHTTHCLPSGDIMISIMGNVNGDAKCDFIIIDGETLKVKGTWVKGQPAKIGYDFWYQPYHDVMISTEWGAPKIWKRGFEPDDALDETTYGRSLNFFSWSNQKLIKSINLGDDGITPLETRFLHNPKESQGFVGCCLSSNVFRFYKNGESWDADKVISVKPKKVTNWNGDYLPGMITDIIISLDDKFLYFSNWLHGDVRQYDISDPKYPKLKGQIFLGGKILSDSDIKVIDNPEISEPPKPVYVKGKRLYGGPQMLQLSLDGKRLYVTSSLTSVWDRQFYPEEIQHGSFMVKLDVDTKDGGMKLDPNFFVDFEEGPDGPILAHEMRYPGGDCSSDIWLVNE